MIEKRIVIANELGFHIKPASLFAELANQFAAEITIYCDQHSADGKNLLSLITLGAKKGKEVRISAHGTDEQQAVDALSLLIERNFKEIQP